VREKMSAIEKSFKKDYPISVAGALFTPLVFKSMSGDARHVPYPRLAGMRPFAEYAGFGYGTIRTILAKLKKESLIETVGSREPARYRLGSLVETIRLTRRERPDTASFKILIFAFSSKDAVQRYRMQQILKHFGFMRFAQNAYVNVNFEDTGLRQVLEQEGLSENAYLFSHSGEEDAKLQARLIALWSPERIARSLERFARNLEEFIGDAPLEDEALFCRYFYGGTAYYEHFTSRLPNIPEDKISKEKPLTKIERFLEDFRTRHKGRLIRYYCEINA
jgi:DNA-binding transcriptional regulator PaaX